MTHSCAFVYGTLMSPVVLQAVVRRVPPMQPASIHGFARYRVIDAAYPAIVPHPGGRVKGQLLSDLTEQEVALLDYYEDEDYERQTVTPILQDGSQGPPAYVYVWRPQHVDKLSTEAWDYEEFLTRDLPVYFEGVEKFMADLPSELAL
ncbi:hypothetical protein FOA52_009969 [Chlamydomonas sp. UWO 241]|nr:hypothetical protein FOA52_009969 [Chlamydomonas sp. UWO 241]